MKQYLLLGKNNIILSIFKTRLIDELVEVETDKEIHVGYDYYIDEKILSSEDYEKDVIKAKSLQRINELKQLLKNSDYKAIKYAEGLISEEEYSSIKTERQNWRDEINELEKGL